PMLLLLPSTPLFPYTTLFRSNAVVTIGTFDGVHVGHQKILSTLRESAKASQGETVLLTFFPHPRLILHPEDDSLRIISDFDEKVDRKSTRLNSSHVKISYAVF